MADVLHAYRDDGPVAETLGPALGRVPVPPLLWVVAGAGALVAGLLVDGRATGLGSVLGVGVFVVALSAVGGRPPKRRLQWLVSPALRAGEYGLIALLGWRAGGAALPIAFALQCAVAFHHYDTVYRLRQQVPGASDRLRLLGLGWEGRMIVLLVAAMAGAFAVAAAVLAVWCAVLFVSDSVAHWVRATGAVALGADVPAEDDED
jgi:hypothetical protein